LAVLRWRSTTKPARKHICQASCMLAQHRCHHPVPVRSCMQRLQPLDPQLGALVGVEAGHACGACSPDLLLLGARLSGTK
jgi:hypothetical protein